MKKVSACDFRRVTTEEILEKINNQDTFYLMVGRDTCGYCRLFAPKLEAVAQALNLNIYWLDTDDYGDTGIPSFREQHGIRFVPSLLQIISGKVRNLQIESSFSNEKLMEILAK